MRKLLRYFSLRYWIADAVYQRLEPLLKSIQEKIKMNQEQFNAWVQEQNQKLDNLSADLSAISANTETINTSIINESQQIQNFIAEHSGQIDMSALEGVAARLGQTQVLAETNVRQTGQLSGAVGNIFTPPEGTGVGQAEGGEEVDGTGGGEPLPEVEPEVDTNPQIDGGVVEGAEESEDDDSDDDDDAEEDEDDDPLNS